VAVLVPCKGNDDPDFENNLLNIVEQDYAGNIEIFFCVESEQDTALPTLRKLEQAYDHVQVCVAGYSTRCAQKTFNILKGMECASDVDIFVIADADIQPHPTWLQELVAPFIDPKVGAATGFFRRIPTGNRSWVGNYLAGFFTSIIMIGVSNDRLKSLWGGSLAIRKEMMDTYQLYDRLSSEIVDDVALMHALHQYKLERRYVKSCTLKSYSDMNITESIEWFVRQIQFLQIYFKPLHAFFMLIIFFYDVYILLTPLLLIYGVLWQNALAIGGSIGFWLVMMVVGTLLWRGIPINKTSLSSQDNRYRLLPWLLVTPLAFVLGSVVMFKTIRRVRGGILHMQWRSIEYHVDAKTGKVMEVIR
jgi:cellulose synthase/poly-beta-1,6-N-acetylglucosamine synthase-like glycosyltransferase